MDSTAEDARTEADELAAELDKATAEIAAGTEALEHQQLMAEGIVEGLYEALATLTPPATNWT